MPGQNETPSAGGKNRSASLRRALILLSALAAINDEGRPSTLTELGRRAGIDRSTALRLLQPLLETRLAEQDPATGRYWLGPQLAYLGHVYLERLDVRRVAGPVLQRLVDRSQETAHVGVPDGTEIVYVHKVESPLPVRMVSRIGDRRPMYCTALGKSYLAYAESKTVERVVAAGMSRRTHATITDSRQLEKALAQARLAGYAIDDQENEPEIRCVAAPVFDHQGRAAGAISLSGPASRMPVKRLHDLARWVMDAAAEISEALGAPPESRPPAGG